MRQALHIFRKDARYLWREICLVLALAAVFAFTNPEWMDMLLLAAASYLLARLVHAEAIPGDRQFWITRPYRWQSLLVAKLLFMLAFVNLPILLAQWRIVAAGGFPFSSYAPGLLWSQVLMMVGVALPVVALAAITSGIVPFTFLMLILAAFWFSTETMLWHMLRNGSASWPGSILWIRETMIAVALAAIVAAVLYAQYRWRETLFSRVSALGGVTILVAAWWYLPWTPAWAFETRLSKQPVDSSLLQISADPNAVRFQPIYARTWSNVDVTMPITVGPVPDNIQITTDALAITLESADGAVWKSEVGSVRRSADKAGRMTLEVTSKMDLGLFNRQRGKPLTIRGSLYLTLFGHDRQQTIPLRGEPVNAQDGLQCYLGAFDQFYCRSAFRWPAELVYAKFGTELSPVTGLISYSPFPASLRLNPIEAHWAPSTPRTTGEVTVVVKEPLAHIRRDFELHGVPVTESPGFFRQK